MRNTFRIAMREFKLAAANKAFVIITILGPFLILAVTVLPSLITRNPGVMSSGKPVAVSGADPAVYSTLSAALETQGMKLVEVSGAQAAKDAVLAGDYSGYLSLSPDWMDKGSLYFTKSGTEAITFGMLEGSLGSIVTERRIADSGIDPALMRRLSAKPGFTVIKLGADRSETRNSDSDFLGILFTALAFVMLLYMTILLYGQMIGRSVVLEKTSKTVEIMLSCVSSKQLMFGKIIGLGMAGILQYLAWMAMGILLILVVGPALHFTMPSVITVGSFVWLVIFFILAFFLYAAGYASLGAAAEDEHHLGQLAWPLIFCLMIPMVMISPIVMNPSGPLTIGLSFFPLTSPIVMLVRVLVSPVAAWELALCVGILLVSIIGMTVFAAKIFRIGILMSGKRPTLSEILRWLRRP